VLPNEFNFVQMSSYVHDKVVPFKESQESKKKQVEQMFDKIAFKYDFLNRFLSLGIDQGWRRKAIKQLKPLAPQTVLDVATGTGDVAILTYELLHPKKITGIDISEGMMKIGRKKITELGLQDHIELIEGDSETIKFPDNSFDAATLAFGVRNFENLEQGLTEVNRVLKKGGMFIVVECSRPDNMMVKPFYQFYMNVITPFFGRIFSRNKEAYQYLNESVSKFPEGKAFMEVLRKTGFKSVTCKKLTLGVCSVYCAIK
jgi:demethylmenaquinone methyltransferase / 2-methoxy-6-polyprenyl-1,4-benzoquinol methylase